MRQQYTSTELKTYLIERFKWKPSDVQKYISEGKLPVDNIEIKKGKQLLKGGQPTYYIIERQ